MHWSDVLKVLLLVSVAFCVLQPVYAQSLQQEDRKRHASTHYADAKRYLEQKNFRAAEKSARGVLQDCQQLVSCVVEGSVLLGDIYAAQGRTVETEAHYMKALRDFDAAVEEVPHMVLRALVGLETLYDDAFRRGDLLPVYEQMLMVKVQMLGPGHEEVEGLVSTLGEAYFEAQDWVGLEELLSDFKSHPVVDEYAQTLALMYLVNEKDWEAYERVKATHPEQFAEETTEETTNMSDLVLIRQTYDALSDAERAWVVARTGHLRDGGEEVDPDVALRTIATIRTEPEATEAISKYLDAVEALIRKEAAQNEPGGSPSSEKQPAEEEPGALKEPGFPQGLPNAEEILSEMDLPQDDPWTKLMPDMIGIGFAYARVMPVLLNAEGFADRIRKEDQEARTALFDAMRTLTRMNLVRTRVLTLMGQEDILSQLNSMFAFAPLLRKELFRLAAERPEDGELAAELLRMVMNAKGRGLDNDANPYAAANVAEELTAYEADQIEPLIDSLRTLSHEISAISTAGRKPGETVEDFELRLGILYERRQGIVAALRQRRPAPSTEIVDVEQVREALPQQSTLVEFTMIERSVQPGARLDELGGYQYAAFTVGPDEDVRFHVLGDGEEVDNLILEVRRLLSQFAESNLEALSEDDDALPNALRELYDHLVAPLGLENEDLFISPEGLLNLLPIEILLSDEATYVLEHHRIAYLSSGRELLDNGKSLDAGNNAFVVFANPDYDTAATSPRTSFPGGAAEEQLQARSKDQGSVTYDRLEATAETAHLITRLFDANDVSVYMGSRASEAELVRLDAPARVHIATHGFFLSDVPDPKDPYTLPPIQQPPHQGLVDRFESPLLRSGLILAGANSALSGEARGRYDGILTAYEVTGMNLHGTDLVVLSACQTGIGEVRNGDGVQGLRRAFQLAGTQTLVTSMWRVADDATNQLMAEFYGQLRQGVPKGDALREAALALRHSEAYVHPYYWGAFTLSGEPE